jgi:hypothetical protein
MSAVASDRFATVAYVYSPSDLALLLSLFESEGIFVMTIGRGHAAVDPMVVTALGGIELRVHHGDAGEARALLASLEPVPYRARLFTGSVPVDLLFLILMLIAFGMAPPPRQIPCFVLPRASGGQPC